MDKPETPPALAARRRALHLLSLAPLMSAAGLAACGGGGNGGGGAGPAPAPAPVPPAPGVAGPAWWGFGRDAQHSAQSAIAAQNLNRIRWTTPLVQCCVLCDAYGPVDLPSWQGANHSDTRRYREDLQRRHGGKVAAP